MKNSLISGLITEFVKLTCVQFSELRWANTVHLDKYWADTVQSPVSADKYNLWVFTGVDSVVWCSEDQLDQF